MIPTLRDVIAQLPKEPPISWEGVKYLQFDSEHFPTVEGDSNKRLMVSSEFRRGSYTNGNGGQGYITVALKTPHSAGVGIEQAQGRGIQGATTVSIALEDISGGPDPRLVAMAHEVPFVGIGYLWKGKLDSAKQYKVNDEDSERKLERALRRNMKGDYGSIVLQFGNDILARYDRGINLLSLETSISRPEFTDQEMDFIQFMMEKPRTYHS